MRSPSSVSMTLRRAGASTILGGSAGLGVQVRIVDRQGGDLPHGEVGEIWALGKSAMTGYLGESRTSASRAGWIATGDLGTVDADGFLTVVGRLREHADLRWLQRLPGNH